MKVSGIQRRAERRTRNTSSVDLNLVSLIDIFTILIFFLLINTGVADVLPSSKAIKLPESTAEKLPRETVVVMVSQSDIVVDGRKVASVDEVIHDGKRPHPRTQGRTRPAGEPPGDPRGERGAEEGDHDHGRQGHPVSPAAQGHGDVRARGLHRCVVRGPAEGGQLMVAAAMHLHAPVLAWSVSAEDEARFKRILRTVLLICLALALAMPWLPVREPDRTAVEPLPPRLAKLLLDREPPAPVLPKPEKPAIKEPVPSAKPVDVQKPEPKAQVVEARRPEANKPPGERLENARARASGVGLLAMKNELAELHAAPAAVQLNKDIKPGPGVGTGVGPGVGAGQGPGVPTRSLITSNVTGGSGGINTAAYSRDTGGGGLAGRSTTLVEGVAGGRGGGGPGGTAHGAAGRRRQGRRSGRHAAEGRQRQGFALDRGDQAGVRAQQGRDLRDLQPRAARGTCRCRARWCSN